MRALPRLLSLSLLVAAAACGSTTSRRFDFVVIDAEEVPRPCLVIVGDDWNGAIERAQYVNVDTDKLSLDIPFPNSEVEVTFAPVNVESGKVTRVPRSRKEAREYSGFEDDVRKLMPRDPSRVLVILKRN